MHGVDAAFTLDGLEEHGHHVRVVLCRRPQCVDVVEWYTYEPLHQRAEAGLYLGVASGAQRGDAAAMEGVLVDHDLGAVDAFVVAELARQFERRFVCFQPGGAEEHVGHAGEFNQPLGQDLLVRHVVIIAAVDDLAQLVLQGRHQFGVVVPQGVHRNAAQCVQVFATIHIPHPAALAMRQGNRQTAIGVHDMGRGGFDERGRCCVHGDTRCGWCGPAGHWRWILWPPSRHIAESFASA